MSATAASNSKETCTHRCHRRYNFIFRAGSCGCRPATKQSRKERLSRVGLLSILTEAEQSKVNKEHFFFLFHHSRSICVDRSRRHVSFRGRVGCAHERLLFSVTAPPRFQIGCPQSPLSHIEGAAPALQPRKQRCDGGVGDAGLEGSRRELRGMSPFIHF